jgi:catechol 2,3-dioxygenase-like lactoylglutathione lyase family enzyme
MNSVFAHLILDVHNVKRSIGFYRDLLGLRVRQTEELDGHHLAYIGTDGFEILLLEQPEREQSTSFPRGGGVVLNFRVSNLSQVAESLKQVQVNVLRDLEEPPFGERTLLVADPDGYAVLLSEPVGTYN